MERLTIDEAINHANIVALSKRSEMAEGATRELDISECKKCAEQHEQLAEWLKELKEYKDLKEQGKLLKLPCTVGDTVYEINTMRNKVSKFQIIGINISKYGFFIKWNLVDGIYRNLNGFNDDEIGKTVFLTQEEAEDALKKMEENR